MENGVVVIIFYNQYFKRDKYENFNRITILKTYKMLRIIRMILEHFLRMLEKNLTKGGFAVRTQEKKKQEW